MRRLNADGTTLLVVTHDERLAAQAGRVVHMLDGRIVADNPTRPMERAAAPPVRSAGPR
jgi:putative ABC transport system ATP-binding protein